MKIETYLPFLLLIWRIGSVIAFENDMYKYLLKKQLIISDNNYYYLTAKGKETVNQSMGGTKHA